MKVDFFSHAHRYHPFDVQVLNYTSDFRGVMWKYYDHLDLLYAGEIPTEVTRHFFVERVKMHRTTACEKPTPDI